MGTSHLLFPVRSPTSFPPVPCSVAANTLQWSEFCFVPGSVSGPNSMSSVPGVGTLPTEVIHVPFSVVLPLLWNLGFHRRRGSLYPQCLLTEKANVGKGTWNTRCGCQTSRHFRRRLLPPSPFVRKRKCSSPWVLHFKFVGTYHVPTVNLIVL